MLKIKKMKKLDLEVTIENFENDVKKLYTLLRPEISVDEISECREIEVGVVNSIVMLNDAKSNDPVVVRVYALRLLQSMTEEKRKSQAERPLRINRELELAALREASELGITAKLYATFSNGFIYKYVDGDMATFELYDLPVARRTAAKMARLHRIRPDETLVKPKPAVFTILGKDENRDFVLADRAAFDKKMAESEFEELRNGLPKFSTLAEEYERLHDLVFEKDAYGPVCFCHNDLNLSNLLIDRQTKDPILIDFEWVSLLNTLCCDAERERIKLIAFSPNRIVQYELPDVRPRISPDLHLQRFLQAFQSRPCAECRVHRALAASLLRGVEPARQCRGVRR